MGNNYCEGSTAVSATQKCWERKRNDRDEKCMIPWNCDLKFTVACLFPTIDWYWSRKDCSWLIHLIQNILIIFQCSPSRAELLACVLYSSRAEFWLERRLLPGSFPIRPLTCCSSFWWRLLMAVMITPCLRQLSQRFWSRLVTNKHRIVQIAHSQVTETQSTRTTNQRRQTNRPATLTDDFWERQFDLFTALQCSLCCSVRSEVSAS